MLADCTLELFAQPRCAAVFQRPHLDGLWVSRSLGVCSVSVCAVCTVSYIQITYMILLDRYVPSFLCLFLSLSLYPHSLHSCTS
jgi:hypothetical protein